MHLGNIRVLSDKLNRPETKFPSIHVAGTNGKGSSSHLLAAVLQSSGYKTGLYTSPHLKDFRERIKVNGEKISQEHVVHFIETNQRLFDDLKPSFFELTVAMAFEYFARSQVDIAVIEVGLGGRLDSTNIIEPEVSLITNIARDHCNLLGNTLALIAEEKAGVMKPGVPVIIGTRQEETDGVFEEKAKSKESAIVFSQDVYKVEAVSNEPNNVVDIYKNGVRELTRVELQLKGMYQIKNIPGVMSVLQQLNELDYHILPEHIVEGFGSVVDLTGIKGRWQILGLKPEVICDTGHNQAAMKYIVQELTSKQKRQLHMVLGFVNDKDIGGMLELLPKDALYYFCSAGEPRSLRAEALSMLANEYDLQGKVINDPNDALKKAREAAHKDDVIFVGGSTFVVAKLNELE